MDRVSLVAFLCTAALFTSARGEAPRPNILLAISDDQSHPHASAYGAALRTPAFDRVAAAGVLFRHGFAGSPGCSPSRAVLLTGRHQWQLEQAGTHASSFPKKYAVYPELLEAAGYFVGVTGKAWGPGNWQVSGRERNPAGPSFDKERLDAPEGISRNDYAANFAAFLAAKPTDRPFCFWYGGSEPHRVYKRGLGNESGIEATAIEVPPFLPDTSEVRADLADYFAEIEWFDSHLGRMLDLLDERGELENTLVIVTSDNGMPFPRAKANCYDAGWHVPLAIAWPAKVPGGRVVDDFVSFVDFAPTFLEVAGLERHEQMSGRSLMPTLLSDRSGLVDSSRTEVFCGRERHSSSRFRNLGYPMRAIRTSEYLLIRNFHPERWPAGDPHTLGSRRFAFHDIDASPSLDLLIARRDDPAISPFFELAVGKRPEIELYDVVHDSGNLRNLADDPAHADARRRLEQRLNDVLQSTGDPRIVGDGEIWESYPRYSPLREFPAP
jgi:N-sulfoglucosamine sulfohydrolase